MPAFARLSPTTSIVAVLAVVLSPLGCPAQSPAPRDTAAGEPAFDVAVIRPAASQDVMGSSRSHIWSSAADGHLKAQNVTVMALIQYAFDYTEMRIDGGPAR